MAVYQKDKDYVKANQVYPNKHPCSEKSWEKDLVRTLQKNITGVFAVMPQSMKSAPFKKPALR